MNNEVRKETNLEHYKEELKEIVSYHYERPSVMTTEIKNRLDKNIVSGLGTGGERFTDVILNWMAQPYKEPILNDEETVYLRKVIDPFRDMVESIYKASRYKNDCVIRIDLKSDKSGFYPKSIRFPVLEGKLMYKGMEDNKYYSLEELGL